MGLWAHIGVVAVVTFLVIATCWGERKSAKVKPEWRLWTTTVRVVTAGQSCSRNAL